MCAHDNIEDRRVKHMETTRTHKRRNTFGPSGLSLVKNYGGGQGPPGPSPGSATGMVQELM